MNDIVERLRNCIDVNAPSTEEATTLREAAAELERLRELKTPASRELLAITKGCLENAEADVERLQEELAMTNRQFCHQEEIEEQRQEIERLRTALSEDITLYEENKRLRAALEGYACPGIERCSEPKLKDGTCIRAGVGTCGDDAYQALKNPPRGPRTAGVPLSSAGSLTQENGGR